MPVIIPQQVQKPLVSPKPQFSKQLRNIDGARESTTVTFEAQINPADDQLMKVEWFRNGQSIQMSKSWLRLKCFFFLSSTRQSVRFFFRFFHPLMKKKIKLGSQRSKFEILFF
jgi:hypothetical protein